MVDEKAVRTNARGDRTRTFVYVGLVLVYAIASGRQEMVEMNYLGVCVDGPDVTAELLCESWVMRQCSYNGDTAGFKSPDGWSPPTGESTESAYDEW